MALRALGDGRIFAEVSPDVPTVLALHGWGRRAADFSVSLAGLPYVAPDLPGFGASPPPAQAVGARGYVDLLGPVLEQLPGPVLVVGHSFGGRVAVCLAAHRPDVVSGLLLTGAPLLRSSVGRRPNWQFRLARWANSHGWLSEPGMERLRQKHGSVDYRAATGVMREVLVATLAEDYAAELAQIGQPTHLLWGDNDQEVPPRVAEEAARLIKGATVEVIEDVGHGLPLSAPEKLREAVEKMLRP